VLIAAHHVLLAYVGVPCIYYGDEVGLEGGRDPDNRRPFPWDEGVWNLRLYRTLRRLVHLRRRHPALALGRYRALCAEGDVHAFARVHDGEAVVVAVHRGTGGRVALPVAATGVTGRWWDVMDDASTVSASQGGALEDDGEVLFVDLPARGARTFVSDAGRRFGLPPVD
jgi:alpha-glucosidase